MSLTEDKRKEFKKNFKNWGEAQKHNASLLAIGRGAATAVMKITKDDLTPHQSDTNVLFGGNHFMLANMAGAFGVIALLDDGEEPLLSEGKIEFTEASVPEEKLLMSRAIILQENTKNSRNTGRKKFTALIDLTNTCGDLKAQAELHYLVRPYKIHKENIDELRARAKEAFKKAH